MFGSTDGLIEQVQQEGLGFYQDSSMLVKAFKDDFGGLQLREYVSSMGKKERRPTTDPYLKGGIVVGLLTNVALEESTVQVGVHRQLQIASAGLFGSKSEEFERQVAREVMQCMQRTSAKSLDERAIALAPLASAVSSVFDGPNVPESHRGVPRDSAVTGFNYGANVVVGLSANWQQWSSTLAADYATDRYQEMTAED